MKKLLQSLSLLLFLLVGQSAMAGTVTYVYTDPQGTPLAEADATGTITARFDYAPYGLASTASGMSGAPNGPGYTGHVNDPESGFVYMQARYYDPAAGRFLSIDPVGPSAENAFNFNRYAYANNNPVMNMDPDGRAPQPWYQRAWGSVKTFMNTPTMRRAVADIGVGELAGSEAEEGNPALGMAAEDQMLEQMELGEMESVESGGPYSNLKDPSSVGPGKNYTAAQKAAIYQQNRAANGGQLKSDLDGTPLVPSQQSKAGVPTPANAAQVDHYIPRNPADPSVAPGTNSFRNARVLSAAQNQAKSNYVPPPPPPPLPQRSEQ
jgi:RHS repeat-associated protein